MVEMVEIVEMVVPPEMMDMEMVVMRAGPIVGPCREKPKPAHAPANHITCDPGA